MPRYLVSASSFPSGTYDADNQEDAVMRYIEDAGFKTIEEAARACGLTVERFRCDLIVIDEKFLSEPDPRDSNDNAPPEA